MTFGYIVWPAPRSAMPERVRAPKAMATIFSASGMQRGDEVASVDVTAVAAAARERRQHRETSLPPAWAKFTRVALRGGGRRHPETTHSRGATTTTAVPRVTLQHASSPNCPQRPLRMRFSVWICDAGCGGLIQVSHGAIAGRRKSWLCDHAQTPRRRTAVCRRRCPRRESVVRHSHRS